LAPEEKIQKNKLSNGNRVTIIMGLSVAKVVGDFIQCEVQIDPEYPEKLKAGFLQEYYRLWQAGFSRCFHHSITTGAGFGCGS